jgi:hypothetical protein
MMTSVWGRDVRGGRKWGNNAVYEAAEEGTVYTDNLANVSITSISTSSPRACHTKPTFICIVSHIRKVISKREIYPLVIFGLVRNRFLE